MTAVEMREVQVLICSDKNAEKLCSHSKSGPVTQQSNPSSTFYFSGSHFRGLEKCTSPPLPQLSSTAKAGKKSKYRHFYKCK